MATKLQKVLVESKICPQLVLFEVFFTFAILRFDFDFFQFSTYRFFHDFDFEKLCQNRRFLDFDQNRPSSIEYGIMAMYDHAEDIKTSFGNNFEIGHSLEQ